MWIPNGDGTWVNTDSGQSLHEDQYFQMLAQQQAAPQTYQAYSSGLSEFATPDSGIVQAYQQALGRVPAQWEIDAWQGSDPASVAQMLAGTPEGQAFVGQQAGGGEVFAGGTPGFDMTSGGTSVDLNGNPMGASAATAAPTWQMSVDQNTGSINYVNSATGEVRDEAAFNTSADAVDPRITAIASGPGTWQQRVQQIMNLNWTSSDGMQSGRVGASGLARMLQQGQLNIPGMDAAAMQQLSAILPDLQRAESANERGPLGMDQDDFWMASVASAPLISMLTGGGAAGVEGGGGAPASVAEGGLATGGAGDGLGTVLGGGAPAAADPGFAVDPATGDTVLTTAPSTNPGFNVDPATGDTTAVPNQSYPGDGFNVDPVTGDTVNTTPFHGEDVVYPLDPSVPTTTPSPTPAAPTPVAPVDGGTLGGAAGAAGAAAGGTAGSGTGGIGTSGGGINVGTGNGLGDLLGGIIGGGIGLAGANRMAEAYERIAGQEQDRLQRLEGYGGGSRQRFEDSFRPDFNIMSIPGLQQAMNTSWDTGLRRLSAQGGNPFGNPGGLAEMQNYVVGNVALPAFQNYQAINSGAGGLTQYAGGAAAGPNLGPAMGAVNAQGQGLAALGTGLGRGLGGLISGGLT